MRTGADAYAAVILSCPSAAVPHRAAAGRQGCSGDDAGPVKAQRSTAAAGRWWRRERPAGSTQPRSRPGGAAEGQQRVQMGEPQRCVCQDAHGTQGSSCRGAPRGNSWRWWHQGVRGRCGCCCKLWLCWLGPSVCASCRTCVTAGRPLNCFCCVVDGCSIINCLDKQTSIKDSSRQSMCCSMQHVASALGGLHSTPAHVNALQTLSAQLFATGISKSRLVPDKQQCLAHARWF